MYLKRSLTMCLTNAEFIYLKRKVMHKEIFTAGNGVLLGAWGCAGITHLVQETSELFILEVS